MLSERDIEPAHPEAFDFAFGNLPSASGPSSTAISPGAATARPSSASTARSAGSSSSFRRTSIRQPSSKTGPSPPWSPRSLSRGPPDAARTPRTRTPPGPTRFPAPALPGTGDPGPADSPAPAASGERNSTPAIAADPPPPAGPQARPAVTRLPVWRRPEAAWPLSLPPPRPPSPAPSPSRSAFSEAGRHGHPAFCHHGGQGKRRRSGHRAGNGPTGCVGELDITLTVRHLKDYGVPSGLNAGASAANRDSGTWRRLARSSSRTAEPDVHHDERR